LRFGMWASVEGFARRAGLELEEPAFAPNTRLAHQLLFGLPESVVKNPLIERIYQAYFMDRKNIGDPQILIELTGEFGILKDMAQTALQMPRGTPMLDRHRQEAQAKQFPGMPGFIFDRKSYFGALPYEFWKGLWNPSPVKEPSCTTK